MNIFFKGVGMNYCYTINDMRMIEESNTPEKTEEKKQEKVLRNIYTYFFQHSGCAFNFFVPVISWVILYITKKGGKLFTTF